MGFSTELLFILMLGLVMLGPKQMHAMLRHVARAKAEFDKASRSIKSQLTVELEPVPTDDKHAGAQAANDEQPKQSDPPAFANR